MSTIHHNPFMPTGKSIDKIIDNVFSRSIGDIVGIDSMSTNPAVNIYEENDKYVIELAAPGLKKSDFEIKIEHDALTVSTEVKKDEDEEITGNYKRKEFNYTEFSRKFKVPNTIDRNKVNAQYKNGILSLQLNKIEEAIDKGPIAIEIK